MRFRGLRTGRARLVAGDDLILSIAVQVATILLVFGIQAVLLNNLTKSVAGDYSVATAIVTIAVGLIDLGLVAVIYPRVAQAGTANIPLVRIVLRIRFLVAIVVTVVAVVATAILVEASLQTTVLILMTGTLFSGRAAALRQIFELRPRLSGRVYLVTMLALLDQILAFIGVWFVFNVLEYRTLDAALIAIAFASLPGFLLLALPQRHLLSGTSLDPRHGKQLRRALIASAAPIALVILLGQISAQLETLVLEATMSDRSLVAGYTAAIRPVSALQFLALSLAAILAPYLARSFRRRDNDQTFRWIASFGGRLVSVGGVMIALGCWCFATVVMRIFGSQYAGDSYLMAAFAWVNLVVYAIIFMDQLMLAINLRTTSLRAAALQVIIALPLEFILVRQLGLRGLLLGKLLAYIAMLLYILRTLPQSGSRAYLSGQLRVLPAVIILAAAQIVIGLSPRPLEAVPVVLTVVGTLFASRVIPRNEWRQFRDLRLE